MQNTNDQDAEAREQTRFCALQVLYLKLYRIYKSPYVSYLFTYVYMYKTFIWLYIFAQLFRVNFIFLGQFPHIGMGHAHSFTHMFIYIIIVCKGALARLFLRHLPLTQLAPYFKIIVSPPLCSVPFSFKVFQTVSPTLIQTPPALVLPTNLFWFKQISKGEFTSSTVAFYQKLILIF